MITKIPDTFTVRQLTLDDVEKTRLYERAGMHVVKRATQYEKELRVGKEPGTLTLAE